MTGVRFSSEENISINFISASAFRPDLRTTQKINSGELFNISGIIFICLVPVEVPNIGPREDASGIIWGRCVIRPRNPDSLLSRHYLISVRHPTHSCVTGTLVRERPRIEPVSIREACLSGKTFKELSIRNYAVLLVFSIISAR